VSFVADARVPVNHAMRIDAHSFAELNVITHDHIRADMTVFADSRTRTDDGG